MFLSILAAVLHGVAYAIYLSQIYSGGSQPNPASWSVWAILSTLNALTFWRASKDALATAQFFTGSVAAILVWIYALFAGRFSPLDVLGQTVLISCIVVCVVWWVTKSATYANLVLAGILVWSSWPTILGVWFNGNAEHALPWYLWTTAFIVTTVNVVKRRKPGECHWWLLLVLPIVGIAIHGTVAVLAK